MSKLARVVVSNFINVGTPLLLMGVLWLYLWVFPWYKAYLTEPHLWPSP